MIGRAHIGRPLSDSIVKRGVHDRQLHVMDMVEKPGRDFIRQIVAGAVTAGILDFHQSPMDICISDMQKRYVSILA